VRHADTAQFRNICYFERPPEMLAVRHETSVQSAAQCSWVPFTIALDGRNELISCGVKNALHRRAWHFSEQPSKWPTSRICDKWQKTAVASYICDQTITLVECLSSTMVEAR
jgi:hypothetical protein